MAMEMTSLSVPREEAGLRRERVIINVGGKRFHTTQHTLRALVHTALYTLSRDSEHYNTDTGEYYFDRNPQVFGAVLNFHRTGELHVPHNLCGPTLLEELEFWQVKEHHLKACCWARYRDFIEQRKVMGVIEKHFGTFDDLEEMELRGEIDQMSGVQRMRVAIYRFIDNPGSSVGALLWSYAFMLLLIASSTLLVLASVPFFRVPVDTNSTAVNISRHRQTTLYLLLATDSNPVITYMEDALMFVFFIEWLLRLVTCFNRQAFLKNAFNLIDLLAIAPMIARYLIRQARPDYRQDPQLLQVYGWMLVGGVFRFLRLVKLGRSYMGLKVLILSLMASVKEISILFFLMFLCSLVFAVCVYLSEVMVPDSFDDMTEGAWWALITMTTVGYGDFTPKTNQGRLIGIACALVGIVATGLPIPIIANNFAQYYTYAHMTSATKEKEKQKIKLSKVLNRAFGRTRRAFVTKSESGLSALASLVMFTRSTEQVTQVVEKHTFRDKRSASPADSDVIEDLEELPTRDTHRLNRR